MVEVRRLPLLAASGEAQGEVVFLTDRTGVEALERALAEREQMAALGELAAGMAHELRNALATMRGYLRLLPGAHPEESARFVAAINDEAEGVAQLLDRFLRFAQPHELRREPLDLAALVEEAACKVRAAFPAVDVRVEAAPAAAVGDALALGVVVENLLRNAAEAVGRGGLGDGAGRGPARRWCGSWSRTTVPACPRTCASACSCPFVSSKPSGGLGLALARRFARLHGGDVEYEPRAGRRLALRGVAAPAGGRVSAPVLVVEDRSSLGEMLAETLRKEGHEVELVLRGDAAVESLQQGGPYLAVITDLKLPGADGLAVLRAARTVDPLLPVFLITGYATVETAVDAAQARGEGLLPQAARHGARARGDAGRVRAAARAARRRRRPARAPASWSAPRPCSPAP